MVTQLFISTLLVFYFFTASAKGGGKDYVVLINGGVNVKSNRQRYFENVRSMYEAFRGNGIPSNQITVLYGSGKVEDTSTPGSEPELPSAGSEKRVSSTPAQGGGGPFSMQPPQSDGITSGEITKTTTPAPPSTLTLDYLFNGEKRMLDGGANSQTIKEKFRDLRTKLKAEDNVTLYITDHGMQNSDGGTSIGLWGETISANELGDLLRDFSRENQIRVVTNICYGGGLTELTSSNICVFANQQATKASISESIDLDLYSQNFSYALKKKLDVDEDGKVTYWDAHQYATSLDNPANVPTTSLEWFLFNNKNKILEEKSKKIPTSRSTDCDNHPDDAMRQVTNLIEDFDRMKVKIGLSTDKIPSDRQHLAKGRLERAVQSLKNGDASTIMERLDLKIQDLKAGILKSAKGWDKLSSQKQAEKRQEVQLEAQQIKSKLDQLQKDRRQYEIINLELDVLKYADDNMVKEYSMIRRCLDYAY